MTVLKGYIMTIRNNTPVTVVDFVEAIDFIVSKFKGDNYDTVFFIDNHMFGGDMRYEHDVVAMENSTRMFTPSISVYSMIGKAAKKSKIHMLYELFSIVKAELNFSVDVAAFSEFRKSHSTKTSLIIKDLRVEFNIHGEFAIVDPDDVVLLSSLNQSDINNTQTYQNVNIRYSRLRTPETHQMYTDFKNLRFARDVFGVGSAVKAIFIAQFDNNTTIKDCILSGSEPVGIPIIVESSSNSDSPDYIVERKILISQSNLPRWLRKKPVESIYFRAICSNFPGVYIIVTTAIHEGVLVHSMYYSITY